MSNQFQIATLSPGLLRPSIAMATVRAGGVAVRDFEFCRDAQAIGAAIRKFDRAAQRPFGIRLDGDAPGLLEQLLAELPQTVKTLILHSTRPSELADAIRPAQAKGIGTLLEVCSAEDARTAASAGFDGLIAKGNEAGGRVGEETTFILLQAISRAVSLQVWARGGIGMHTIAACAAAGARGVVLDLQLALTRESPYPAHVRAKIANMDGSETVCLGSLFGEAFRVYSKPGDPVVKELQELEKRLANDPRPRPDCLADWRAATAGRAGWSEQSALLVGQDAAFAARLAERFLTVGGIVQELRRSAARQCQSAATLQPLAEGSPLAAANGTRYPILQGPMTRVSDVPEFAACVAEGGALPFLALALLRGPEVRAVLAETRKLLGSRPWGVGILGFVPQELRLEQIEAVLEYRPPFALIAGGRPDQARDLEAQGIASYLHVPSPGLLKMFIQNGSRRFVFEGRECGGHVGPRSSFVLWDQMVDVLLSSAELAAGPADFHVVFAGGIHDALSSAMVAAIAAPLAALGVRVGVLLGTAYLFTREAVASGAIQETFQEQATACRNTVLLETGPGHSTRCVGSPFAEAFAEEKKKMLAAGRTADEIRMALEDLNLGRLRIASKGVTRHPKYGQDPAAPKLLEIGKDEQVAQGMYMIGQVAALRDSVSTIQQLHDEVSVEGSRHLQQLASFASGEVPPVREQVPSDVAIVGMACRLPKAPDLAAYWANIVTKVNAIGEVPKERWDPELYFDADPKAKDKIYSKWGGFLDDVAFDPVQYGMPPASLRSIEPAQLLTLEVVRAALADAGYLTRSFPRERTSVILGAGGGAADLGLGYGARSFMPMLEELPEFRGRSKEIIDRLAGRLPEWTEDSFPGILTNVAAGRVANRFDLGGSNFTVDAACASSLAAVSLALTELESHNSDMVIVGGIDTMQNPFTYLCFSKTHALSPRGRCRTFDETADGIAISEGIVMMVFKRLADAERDGDRIYAVIKGVGSSSDGKDRGLTAPRPEGQAVALRRAYAKAGISPATVGLVEAHGTGTVAGDGAEVQALTRVFSEAEAPRQGCAIGSVKSMIGHTKCSAGAAGLAKAALALHHKVLPPTIGVDKPNAKAKFPETPFYINTEPRPWLESPAGHPRRAGVSAFGFGGTNFHVVMEEYTGDPFATPPAALQQWPEELLVWKAGSRGELAGAVEKWASALGAGPAPALRDLAFTSWKQAEAATGAVQLAIVASSVDDLREKLARAQQSLGQPDTARINDPRGIYYAARPLAREGKLAFLFPGQGSQYPRMLQDLFLHFPEMRPMMEKAAGVLAGKLPSPLSSYVFPAPSFSREEEQVLQKALTQTNVAQPALGAVSLALFELLDEFGLRPDMMAGHSYGEYAALAAAGVFDADTLIALSEARGRFIVEGAGAEPGTMAAIEADAVTVAEVLRQFDGACLANCNGPKQTVISGTPAAVEGAVRQFAAQGLTARSIPVACAFHSPLVAPAQPRLAEFLAGAGTAAPKTVVFSNTTAEPYPSEPEAIRQRLVDHLTRPVEFVREIEAMYQAGARIFVEVGPRGVLTGLADQILGDRPKLAVASDQNGRPGLAQLLHLFGQLTAHGVALKLDRLYRERSSRRLDLGALEREVAVKPLAPSVWMVNGARAIPLKKASPAAAPAMAMAAAAGAQSGVVPVQPYVNGPAVTVKPYVNGSPAVPVLAAQGQLVSEPVPAAVPTASVTTAPQNVSQAPLPEGAPQVMAQFQQMMARFLETQKSVMLAYLGTESGTEAAVPVAMPEMRATSWQAPEVAGEPAPRRDHGEARTEEEGSELRSEGQGGALSHTAPAPSGPSRAEITAQLLTIVSERTGYPTEMLDLKLDLEADLGIDSIKRVEILGTLQQAFTDAGLATAPGLMEQLSGVRTLQGIIDQVAAGVETPQRETASEAPQGATAPPPAPGLDRKQLTDRLLLIVSERTGYPIEMLDLKLDLEADLGIDSIKRVEILGTLQQSMTSGGLALPEGMMEKLAGVRTLQGIIDGVCQAEPAPSTTPPPAESATSPVAVAVTTPVAEPAERIQRFRLTAVETPLPDGACTTAKEQVVLIAGDGHPLCEGLARELAARGCRVAAVRNGPAVHEFEAGKYTADLHSAASIAEVVALVAQRQGQPGTLVHMGALRDASEAVAGDIKAWKEQHRGGAKGLFLMAKAAGLARANLIAVTSMGGSFLTDPKDRASFPDHGAITGLMKTIAIERPEVRVKTVDLDAQTATDVLAAQLAGEVLSDAAEVEVGYSRGGRVTLQLEPAPLDSAAPLAGALEASAVVLVTGGARGITALTARMLAERYRPTLILSGRTPEPAAQESPATCGLTSAAEIKGALMAGMRQRGYTVSLSAVEHAYAQLLAEREVRANLSAIRQAGATVHYRAVDVRNAEAFGAFLDGIYETFGRLDGVIHGAGVIDDRLVADKSPDSFDRVFDTKADSGFVLSRKLRPDSLRFLVFFSSVSGRFGNRGQADYAAANEVLNKLAVCLDRNWSGRAIAIAWGPWDSEGMVSAEVRRQFADRGVALIPPATGVQRLLEELTCGRKGDAEVVIGGAGWKAPARAASGRAPLPLLRLPLPAPGNDGFEFIHELDTARDLYLNDHRLDGQPVLPLAVATELIAESVAQAWPHLQVTAVRDLRMLKGVVLENGSKALRVVVKPKEVNANGPSSVAVEIGPAGQKRLHYRATVELAERLAPAPQVVPPALHDGRPFPMPLDQLYGQWLFHGPLFQGICRVDAVGVSGIRALLASSSPQEWLAGKALGPWLIDPLVFDSALQLLVLWAREHLDMTALPAGFQSFHRYAAPPAERVLCELRLRPETRGHSIHADIYFLDAASGAVLGILENMEGACSKALNRLAGSDKPSILASHA
ncbi:MAG: SDR family NAD(P)-dependent oxidoreductase [Candidatus Solibacter sp.]